MKRFFFCLLIAFIAIVSQAPVSSFAHPAGDPWTAHYMWRRYHNATSGCSDNPNAPVYECVGIIIRATNPQKEGAHPWWPEDKSMPGSGAISAGGVSFSYLRDDIVMTRFAYDFVNGFTLYPSGGKYGAPTDKIKLQVLCAFPFDGATDGRDSQGCGTYGGARDTAPCETLGITTASAWTDYYLKKAKYYYETICGYSMEGNQSKDYFNTLVQIHKDVYRIKNGNLDESVNEIRIKSWGRDLSTSKTLPIESFYYAKGSATGRTNAQNDQLSYYKETGGIFVPVIELTIPKTGSQHFDFHYNRSDQHPNVQIPVSPNTDPNPCTLGDFDQKC